MNNLLSAAFVMSAFLYFLHSKEGPDYQAVTGSWQVTDMRETITDKKAGRTEDINKVQPGMLDELKKRMEYNCVLGADHTIDMHSGFKGGKMIEMKGTYTLDGDKLRFKGTTPEAFKAARGGSSLAIPDFVAVSFEGQKMVWHYAVDTEEEGHVLRSDIYLIWQRK